MDTNMSKNASDAFSILHLSETQISAYENVQAQMSLVYDTVLNTLPESLYRTQTLLSLETAGLWVTKAFSQNVTK